MPSILIRAHKHPLRVAGPEETVHDQLLGNNTGNLVFSQAVCRLLSTAGTDIRTSNLTDAQPLRRVGGPRADRLVLPLANAFRPGYADRLDRLSAIMAGARVPVTVLGVGAQATLSGQRRRRDETDRAVQRFVRTALRHGTGPIGVRGEYTRDYLAGLGFGPADVTVIGCPSMFMYGPDLQVQRKATQLTSGSRIALNISPYVAALGPISRRHAERYPRLTYLAQNQASLELLLTGRYPARPESATFSSGVPVTVDHPLISEGRVRFFLDPTTWMEHLAGYDFSFGSRIHGNIAALLAGTPALVLAHDSRTLELARYHEIPYRLITDDPDHIDAAQLYADADWEPLNAGHAARWQVFRDFLGQHGLRTVYDDGEDRGARFDEQLAAVAFPPPVGAPTGASPELLWQLRRELTEARRELIDLRAGGRVAAVATAARVSLWPGWMSHPPGRLSLLPARLTDGLRNMLSAALDRSVRPARVGRPVGRRLRGPGGFGRPRLGLRRSVPDGVPDPTADGSGTTEDCVLTR